MVTDCIHHWIIEIPAGPSSKGRCKRCRINRTFSNTIKDKQRPHTNPKTGVITMTRDITFGESN